MEDASDGVQPFDAMTGPMKNGEVSPVKELELEAAVGDDTKSVKINGDSRGEVSDADDSSDCDNLVIDERPQSNRKRKLSPESQGFRGFKRVKSDSEYEPPMNPYFNESLFELSELHQIKKNSGSDNININDTSENQIAEELSNSSNSASALIKLKQLHKKKKGNPKLQEYAQYLGLQPTVQFKCSKCAQTGFPSLAVLNEHHKQCRALGPVAPPVTTNSSSTPSTNFRVTRKVFLCSACGTYYENWNLFLHMREMHKRFICLYCLGMFSLPEKLSLHLVSKHNCVPSQLNSEEDFFRVYKEPCFLMCCDCEKVFSERDNFFGHNCHGKQNKLTEKTKNAPITSKPSSQKQVQKNSKQLKNKAFVEHVTGDMSEPDVPKETDVVESTSSDKSEQKQNISDEDTSTSDKVKALEMKEEDLETNVSENIQDQEGLEEASELSVPTNLPAMETDTKSEENDSLPNEKDLITDNHVISKESLLEDELEVNLPESSTVVDPGSPLGHITQDEESSHSLHDEDLMDECDSHKSDEIQEETRKVPKVTLKLPKSITTSYIENDDSDASDKLTMEIDAVETETAEQFNDIDKNDEGPEIKNLNVTEPSIVVAGPDIPIVELELEQPLDKFNIQVLLQKCLKATVSTCVYCNHAKKIAVNGKQLGLHAIAEHRFSAIVNSITAEELIPESFVMRIKESLSELEDVYFNLESTSTEEGITFSHVFECFQCRYATTIHKELYLHNRKMHANTILLCIMCKSNFYSYSELICHLCPGLYELNNDVSFRCCMCVSDNLPSAFRLMVHLRKRHHACDVCLELCHNQSRLSNHVWKHKLHHLCYRCGIAYRNKPDITKHLFWKHGTESVVCKKCLQKKWPHMYHFCTPPSTFTCEECNLNFTKAVALKVHKRLHTGEKLHACSFEDCTEKFISKKLLLKHEFKHREPPEEALGKDKDVSSENAVLPPEASVNSNLGDKIEDPCKSDDPQDSAEKPKPKPKVDVYDLPELNLSESDSSDSEDEAQKNKPEVKPKIEEIPINPPCDEEKVKIEVDQANTNLAVEQPPPVLDNIWDDFKNYQANKEKKEPLGSGTEPEPNLIESSSTSQEDNISTNRKDIVSVVMMDHDYSVLSQEFKPDEVVDSLERKQSLDHDYCSANAKKEEFQQETLIVETTICIRKETKASSSSDSSGSDSSSCSCGSNCSCSSSSDSSSSSSDSSDSDSSSSEGRRRQQARRERRKQRTKIKKITNSPIDVVATDHAVTQTEQLIQESDLDTTESDTDEDFYDKQPQKLAKLLAEKRKELLLLAGIGTLINGSVLESSRPSTPSLPETEVKPKKKSKNKKKKKKNKKQEKMLSSNIPSTSYQYQSSTVSPLTISLPKNSPLTISAQSHSPINNAVVEDQTLISIETHDSKRASKRRRIPNKFYGYSSDEEQDRHQPPVLKWRKSDLPSPIRPTPTSPLVVPPITIKAVPPLLITQTEDVQPRQQTEIVPRLMHNFNTQHAQIASQDIDTSSESNDSSSGEEQPPQQFVNKPNQPPLYCYCRCPYDEVSEMIGCDSNDCLIEWFHFECVGIMVPPKGQWFCPDCRKKKQQKKELVQTQC